MNISTTLETVAQQSAATLIAHGWAGGTCDLGSFHGDLETAEEAVGRKLTRDERVELEGLTRGELSKP